MDHFYEKLAVLIHGILFDSSEDDDSPGDAPSESESVHEQALDNIPNLSENHLELKLPKIIIKMTWMKKLKLH